MTTEAIVRDYLAQASETEIYLIDSIWAEPLDPVNRLIYSDLVEMAGDMDRAARIRRRVEQVKRQVPCFACRGSGTMKNEQMINNGEGGYHRARIVHDLEMSSNIHCTSCMGKGFTEVVEVKDIAWILGF